MLWIVIAIGVLAAISAYLTGEGNGTRSTQRYWQQLTVDGGFAEWKANHRGDVHFRWRTDKEIAESIEAKKKLH